MWLLVKHYLFVPSGWYIVQWANLLGINFQVLSASETLTWKSVCFFLSSVITALLVVQIPSWQPLRFWSSPYS